MSVGYVGSGNNNTNASWDQLEQARQQAARDQQIALASTTAPNTNTQTTDPMGGWAGLQGYNPSQIGATIWDNPFQIIPRVFGNGTANNDMFGTPGYNTLRNLNFDPLTMYVIGQGANSSMTSAGADDYVNWLRDMYLNYGTQGGRSFNSRELLGKVGDAAGGDGKNALGQALRAGDNSTQVRTTYNMLSDIYNAGMNPVTASALRAGLTTEGDRYLAESSTSGSGEGANSTNFAAWLRQNAPYLYGR
jgi:hypothetical protein